MKRAMLVLTAVLVLQLFTATIGYTAPPTSCPIYHAVAPGETLFYIGRLYGVSPWAIAQINYIPNPDLIYVGQVLYIPCRWGWQPYKPPCWKPCYYPCCVHIVQPCENLTKIALWHGTTVWAIAQANYIPNPNFIYIGQRLVIPCN